ncbi:unnamed protein product [Brugia timori]|uniref:Ovule protein n=1 Tax=Brugia timori TaxID=42155 RepID=A0A0R3QEK0_9BILA|nr:unnamed protein product [Brugia timori]
MRFSSFQQLYHLQSSNHHLNLLPPFSFHQEESDQLVSRNLCWAVQLQFLQLPQPHCKQFRKLKIVHLLQHLLKEKWRKFGFQHSGLLFLHIWMYLLVPDSAFLPRQHQLLSVMPKLTLDLQTLLFHPPFQYLMNYHSYELLN